MKKEAPQFGDTLTKVWGTHTIKIGGFTQTTDNFQSSFSYNEDGIMSFNGGQHPDLVNPGERKYRLAVQLGRALRQRRREWLQREQQGAHRRRGPACRRRPLSTTPGRPRGHLTLELGIRIEHVGHWYDRDHIGLAVFYPGRVLTDYEARQICSRILLACDRRRRTAERPT